VPAKKKTVPSSPSRRKVLPAAPAKAAAKAGTGAAVSKQLEEVFHLLEDGLANHSDPALSSLLGRLASLEERLEKLILAVDRGLRQPGVAKASEAIPAPAPVSSGGRAAAADPDTAQFLARTPLFAKLTAAECSVLAQVLETKALAAGADLFKQDDFGDAMYVVKSGVLEILKSDVLGPLRVAQVRPGSLVGEMALVEDKPRSANVRAAEDSRLLVLSRGTYAELKKSHPQLVTKFQDELLLLMSARLRQTTEKLVGRS
jgi:CRP/FNR family cyclic AMP-dependent transcriptional regulator